MTERYNEFTEDIIQLIQQGETDHEAYYQVLLHKAPPHLVNRQQGTSLTAIATCAYLHILRTPDADQAREFLLKTNNVLRDAATSLLVQIGIDLCIPDEVVDALNDI